MGLRHLQETFLAIDGARALDPHEKRGMPCLRQRQFAARFGLARKDLLHEVAELAAVALGDELTEAPVHQLGAPDAEQSRPGQIHLSDHSPGVEGQVARRGEFVGRSIVP
jgi:hypothetical protein